MNLITAPNRPARNPIELIAQIADAPSRSAAFAAIDARAFDCPNSMIDAYDALAAETHP